MEEQTYTNRRQEEVVIREVNYSQDRSRIYVSTSSAWNYSFAVDDLDGEIREGETYVMETQNFSTIGGIRDMAGHWLCRRSDQQIHEEWSRTVEENEARHRKSVEEGMGDYIARTLALPEDRRNMLLDSLKDDEFVWGYLGWGYTLTAEELLVTMREHGVDSKEAEEFSDKHGVSGNQWGWAQAFVKARG